MALKRDTYTQPTSTANAKPRCVGGREDLFRSVLGVSPRGTVFSADLGGSSKYSNENFED